MFFPKLIKHPKEKNNKENNKVIIILQTHAIRIKNKNKNEKQHGENYKLR